ncbi:MAG: hypothetical protein GWP19_06070 [Planctomycetia bacterium]|nr:hypothetical protein [Planctomycetia bacterium]
MVQLRTTILGYLHISLVLALILIGVEPNTAQQKEATIFLQNLDAEIDIPEEDIFLINEILKGQWSLGKELARQLMKLSFIDYDDEQVLSKVSDSKSLLIISQNNAVSDNLRQLITIIGNSVSRNNESGDILVNQYIVFNDDYRYRWKLNYSANDYSAGLIAERDPNEKKLIDHLSGYLFKKYNSGELLVGDYQIVTGFGLWSWRSVSTRKSFETITGLPRMGRGISPYHSSNESWYLRGIGYTNETKWGNLLISGGYTLQDGKLDSAGNLSLSSSGFHTGATSIAQQNNISELVLLSQWNYDKPKSQIAISVAGTNWQDKRGIKKNDWSGSIAFNQLLEYGNIFGEIGRGYNRAVGIITGLRLKIPNVKYLLSSRYYSKGYSALRSNPFAEWVGKDRNEFGLFQSISYKHNRNLFTIYGDLFRTSDVEKEDSFPKSGQETGLRWERRKGRRYQRLQWKWEKKSLENNGIYLLAQEPVYESDNTLKYSGVFNLNKSWWGKLQLTYTLDETSDSKSHAYGLDTQIWWEVKNISIFFDIVTTKTYGGSAWIYFWDVNLPGEMTTRVYTKDVVSPAIKILYQTNSGFELGFRLRALWKDFDFTGTTEIVGALVLEIML